MDYEKNAKKQKRSPNPSTAGNTSSASASASASAFGGKYEVFLSFCGKDTRYTFTDFLYTSLVGARIHTFRDDNELRVGENIGSELLKAINESKISIPIFSKNYASSKWCLRELSQIVECQTSMGQKIFPIFFDVEPSDVRHQTGSYEAVGQHKEDEKTVQEWKGALKKVGALKGLELKKETNGHQGELAKKVSLKVLSELKKNHTKVPGELFGMDHHVEEMRNLLNVHSNDVQIVGIVGMGGIGKTTIAKVIFNQLSEHYNEGCCFITDVRERSKRGIVELQKELCSKILKGELCSKIFNVDDGLDIIENRVCTKKVLIVLDDVDEKYQFDNLVGKRELFAPGSRIIVTTRDKRVLHLLGVDNTYEPPPMESNHSLQLFSKHAFRKDFPPEKYHSLSIQFVSIAAGLPLSLEVIGSYLYYLDASKWRGTLKKLKEVPLPGVKEKLKISYEALDPEQKQIFLDIACFLIGEDKRVAFYMWDEDDCNLYPVDGIEVLVLRSLVKIGDDNILKMHDQLRDLGREIVRLENLNEPWQRSRVWSCKEASKTLKECKETQKDEAFKVEALCIESALFMESDFPFPNQEFGQLKNLRYLQVDEGRIFGDKTFVGDSKDLFPKLRWLKWHGLLRLQKVTNLHLRDLVILDLSGSNFREKRESWNQIKMAKNLKVLNLTRCYGLIEIPDFSTFASLEMLILRNCRELVRLDRSIRNLRSLKVLDISGSSIMELPNAIGNLEKLEEINASKCVKLQGEFPDIRRLSSLRILNLKEAKIYNIPRSICELTGLQTLDLSFGMLQSLPELPSSLTSLRATFKSMRTFPSLSKLKSLKELYFICCFYLVEIPKDIEKLSELEILDLGETSISTLPVEIGGLPRLKILSVHSKNLQYIQGLPSSLFKLCIFGSKSMERLPDLSNLKNMSTLYVDGCSKLAKLDGLDKLESLRYLLISNCESLQRLPDLSNLGMLKELKLYKCQKLAGVEGLSSLKSLEILDLSYCTSLEKILDLSELKKLRVCLGT